MKAYLSGAINIAVTVLSLFYTFIAAAYIYTSLIPSKAMSVIGKPGAMEALQFLILFSSTVYYHKSNKPRMRLISSIGCISMVIVLLIIY
jgi:hypothetical protein